VKIRSAAVLVSLLSSSLTSHGRWSAPDPCGTLLLHSCGPFITHSVSLSILANLKLSISTSPMDPSVQNLCPSRHTTHTPAQSRAPPFSGILHSCSISWIAANYAHQMTFGAAYRSFESIAMEGRSGRTRKTSLTMGSRVRESKLVGAGAWCDDGAARGASSCGCGHGMR
jgi:hypothetical protein